MSMIISIIFFLGLTSSTHGQSDCFISGACEGMIYSTSRIEETYNDCLHFCQERGDCDYFTWYSSGPNSEKECIIWSGPTCLTVPCPGNSNCWSGQKTCGDEPPLCSLSGLCQGPYISTYPNGFFSELQCQELCANTVNCAWYNYNPGTNACAALENCFEFDSNCTTCRTGEMACYGYNLGDDSIYLDGGNTDSEGNVWVRMNGSSQFLPVCDDSWISPNSDVVCRQLGYSSAITHHGQSYYGQPGTNGLFAMDNVFCTGTESRIQDCEFESPDNCSEFEAIGVVCSL